MYHHEPKKIVATIEARMTSTRLPGKVLLPIGATPALELLISRLKRSNFVDEIVVATTINEADNPIVGLAERLGVRYFRGSEADVLDRVLNAAQSVQADIIVEITGDCPFVDWRLVDRGVEEFFAQPVDYASNTVEATFPNGFDVQVFPTTVLADVAKRTQDPVDRTHVSYYIYTHPEVYRVHNWVAGPECHGPELRVTLDEEADYQALQTIFAKLFPHNPDFSAADVVKFLRENPDVVAINNHVRQKDATEL